MQHGAVRKLGRAAIMSFFVLATTSSVAGLEVLTASSALADTGGQDNGSDPGATSPDQGRKGQDPQPGGGLLGGGGGLLGGNGGGLLGG